MIAPADQFGPWRNGIDPAERLARLRSLRAIARLTLGRRGDAFVTALQRAETDPTALEPALQHLADLAPTDRRHVLASFASLHRIA
ncbi:hypothetical protein MKK55_11475 [Methylobacterium sp. J-059]|uniref:hypothetical protein n=1 Tax=Methylobacterium sp. J-059 TaxID=2836643 RepID=UPI001FB937CF|nr:hypothetical protein [Methylobacterium sp. J-059]MCJ2039556.1 hypothetical protein [Methylobacterium sp. J-059]